MTYVLDHSKASNRALLVHLALADRCVQQDPGDGEWRGPYTCWPGFNELAKRSRVTSRRQISRLIADLKQLGEIEEIECRKGRLKIYKLTGFARHHEESQTPERHPDVPSQGTQMSPHQTVTGHLRPPDGTSASLQRDIQVPVRGHLRSPYITDKQKEQEGTVLSTPPPAVELPDRFPQTAEQARQWTLTPVPQDFIDQWWSEAAGAGGKDPYTGKPIHNWSHWIAAKHNRLRSRESEGGPDAKNPARKKSRATSETALRIELDRLEKEIHQMPGRPGSEHLPTPGQKAEYQTARERRSQILAQLSAPGLQSLNLTS